MVKPAVHCGGCFECTVATKEAAFDAGAGFMRGCECEWCEAANARAERRAKDKALGVPRVFEIPEAEYRQRLEERKARRGITGIAREDIEKAIRTTVMRRPDHVRGAAIVCACGGARTVRLTVPVPIEEYRQASPFPKDPTRQSDVCVTCAQVAKLPELPGLSDVARRTVPFLDWHWVNPLAGCDCRGCVCARLGWDGHAAEIRRFNEGAAK